MIHARIVQRMSIPWCLAVCIGLLMVVDARHAAYGQSWQEIAGELMSPACPGRTLLNCTSGQAEQWRELIRQKLAQGDTKAQILRHFVDIGGDAILASPPKRGFGLMAWLVPCFFVVNGAVLLLILTRRWARRRPSQTPLPGSDEPTSPDSLMPTPSADPYRDRLQRELKEFNA